MAPEQKDLPGTVDARADIYSLGVVFYEMLTGERPGIDLTPPSQKATLDVRIDEVVLRALNSEPEQRWQSATALQTRLQTILTDPPQSPPSQAPAPGSASSPKRAWTACILSLLSVLVLGLSVVPINVSRLNNKDSRSRQFRLNNEHSELLREKENLERSAHGNLKHETEKQTAERVVEQNRLQARADEVQKELDAISAPISAGRRHAPMIITIVILVLGVGIAIMGFALGWRHLSWLRGQSPEVPALAPGMFAALFWPMLLLGGLAFGLILGPLQSSQWGYLGLLLSLATILCLGLWIIWRILSWIKSQPHPFSKSKWLLALPLLALSVFIPLSQFYIAAEKVRKEAARRDPPLSQIQSREKDLREAIEVHIKALRIRPDSNHWEVRNAVSRVNMFEDMLKSGGSRASLESSRRVLSEFVASLQGELNELKESGVDPGHPERAGLERALSIYQRKLDELPEFTRLPEPDPLKIADLLPSFFMAAIFAGLGIFLIRKSRV